jgi:hypothetical protein
MKIAVAHLESTSPYSQSRPYKEEVAELPKELPDDFEKRTWMYRTHVNKEGNIFIPGGAFVSALQQAAKRLSIKVPGRRGNLYTKHFEAGIMCLDGLTLPLTRADVACDKLYLNYDGVVGGGKRVWRYMPRIDSWSGPVTFHILDDVITEDVFNQVLVSAGLSVGIGRFRPEKRGFYGRFALKSLDWQDESVDQAAE